MTVYTLPELPYDYSALEPHISGHIMELHHDKHHAAYVTGANAALDNLANERESNDLSAVNLWEKNLAFNLGGHLNHSLFWTNMSPDGGGEPKAELAEAIKQFFGSFERFKAQFAAVAAGTQGSGWVVLAWDSVGQQLLIVQLYDHQGNLPLALIPIVLLDCWEHAYYLDYRNVRADYVTAWWNIVNWQDAAERLARARTQTKGLVLP